MLNCLILYDLTPYKNQIDKCFDVLANGDPDQAFLCLEKQKAIAEIEIKYQTELKDAEIQKYYSLLN